MSKISVIVAAWNAQKTIDRCLQSIIAQVGVDVEIIVIDDCSTDDTYKKVLILSEKYPEIIIHKMPKNGGPSAARNHGISVATGDWVAVVDADDTIKPNRLSTMLRAGEENNSDIVFDNLNLLQEGYLQQKERVFISQSISKVLKEKWDVEMYSKLNRPYESPILIGFLKPLMRTEFLRRNNLRYNENLYNSEDYLLILRAIICQAKIHYVDESLYNYYINNSSLSGNFDVRAHENFVNAQKNLLSIHAEDLSDRDRKAINAHLSALNRAKVSNEIFSKIKNKDFADACSIILKSGYDAPMHLKRILCSLINKILGISNRGR